MGVWQPDSWQEFRETYYAGTCHVDFSHNTLDWAARNGWNLKPKSRENRQAAFSIFFGGTAILVLCVILEFFPIWALGGILLLVIISIAVATQPPSTKELEAAFIARMLSSEKDFWDAWRGSGIDLYRRKDDGKFF